MKHIKKYRGSLNRRVQQLLRSRARSKAKQDLSKKYKKHYLILCRYYFNKLRRDYFNQIKGGKTR